MNLFEKIVLQSIFIGGCITGVIFQAPYVICILFGMYVLFLTFRKERVDEGLLKLEKSVTSYFEKNTLTMLEMKKQIEIIGSKAESLRLAKVAEKINK